MQALNRETKCRIVFPDKMNLLFKYQQDTNCKRFLIERSRLLTASNLNAALSHLTSAQVFRRCQFSYLRQPKCRLLAAARVNVAKGQRHGVRFRTSCHHAGRDPAEEISFFPLGMPLQQHNRPARPAELMPRAPSLHPPINHRGRLLPVEFSKDPVAGRPQVIALLQRALGGRFYQLISWQVLCCAQTLVTAT